MMVAGWRGTTPYYSPPTAGQTPQRAFCTYTHTHTHTHTQVKTHNVFHSPLHIHTFLNKNIARGWGVILPQHSGAMLTHTLCLSRSLSLRPPQPVSPQPITPQKNKQKGVHRKDGEGGKIGAAWIHNSAMHKLISMHAPQTHTHTHTHTPTHTHTHTRVSARVPASSQTFTQQSTWHTHTHTHTLSQTTTSILTSLFVWGSKDAIRRPPPPTQLSWAPAKNTLQSRPSPSSCLLKVLRSRKSLLSICP